MKKISIIVPIYNAEEHLDKCVESILEQTETSLEIILVDDGSKDNSFEICKKYEKTDQRVKVIHQENAGVSVAKNHLDKYIHIEYEKMFLSIISLYCQTKQKTERALLKEIYEKNKNQISVNASFHGKFKLLERLMRTRFCFINIYKLYWKCKIKK